MAMANMSDQSYPTVDVLLFRSGSDSDSRVHLPPEELHGHQLADGEGLRCRGIRHQRFSRHRRRRFDSNPESLSVSGMVGAKTTSGRGQDQREIRG